MSATIEIDDLVCPGCGEQVLGERPKHWPAEDELGIAEFSHTDGTPLCFMAGTQLPAEPVEAAR